MDIVLVVLLSLLALGLLAMLMYWLLVTTEGVYLGRGVVIYLYDLVAARYERIKGYEPSMEAYFLSRPIMDALDPNTAPLVLDAATGTARMPRALLRAPEFQGRIVAVDLSRRMLHYAVGRVAEGMHYERVYLMHAPAERLPFADDLFDLVTCMEALEFMMHPRAVIKELVRVVRPGGILVLTNRIGRDAKLMPGKTWSRERAEAIYTEEFGLEGVQIHSWQYDYDLVWARKPGQSLPTRARPLEEFWCCPKCKQTALAAVEGAYVCEKCGMRVPVGKDGVIELQRVS